jgi:hypothetical protein
MTDQATVPMIEYCVYRSAATSTTHGDAVLTHASRHIHACMQCLNIGIEDSIAHATRRDESEDVLKDSIPMKEVQDA